MENIHTATQLLDQYNNRLKDQDMFKLRNFVNDLKTRYDGVLGQSYGRQNRLSSQTEELKRFEDDKDEMETWLSSAQETIQEAQQNVGTSPEELEEQYTQQREFADDVVNHGADLKYLNKTGEKFLDSSKVSRSWSVAVVSLVIGFGQVT